MFSGPIRRTHDQIGARNYGLLLEERIRRMRENHAFLQQMAEEGAQQQQAESSGEEADNQDSYYEGEDEQPVDEPANNFYVYDRPEDVDANMPLNDRILYYSTFVQHYAFSLVQIKQMEALMVVLYGRAPPISYIQNVVPFNEDALTEYNIKRNYYCSSCEGLLSEWRDVCDNEGCELHRVSIKRAKGVQRIEVFVLDIIPQLNDIILREIKNIIDFHRFLHLNRENPANDRSDVRLFPDYYRSIETAEDFDSKRLKLLLSLSIDGCVPKRITRREMWPLYLRVDNLPKKEADKYFNSLLSGIIYSLTKPTPKLLETLFARLEAELSALQNGPIEIDVDGHCWTLDVTLNKGVADLAAQQALFGIPRWNAEQGCSKCYITGQRVERQRVWIASENEIAELRLPESYVPDGERGANGIPKATPLMRMIEPCRFPGDALHVCSEGITKNRLRDLFSRQSRFRELLVNRQGTESIKKCLKEMSCYTYASSIILSLDDLRTCKAAELDEIAFIAFPLSSAVGLIPSPVAAVSLLGYWLCLRITADSRNLTTASIEKAQELARLTKQIWASMAPQIFTMKCHWFFDHGMEEEITSYGSAYQWSSAPFESHHRRLQIKVDQSTTNSSATIIEKYLLNKKMRNLLENRAVTYPAMNSLRNKVDNKHRTRFPIGIPLSDTMYIPKGSRVEPHQLQEVHRQRISQSGEDPYSRLVINGKVYASRTYWKRPSHSRQDMIYLKGRDGSENIDCFGSIILFLYNRRNHSVRVLVDEYEYHNPFEHLGNVMHHTAHPLRRLGLQLMALIEECNSYFQELSRKTFTMRTNQYTPTRGRAPARARLTYAPQRPQLAIPSPQTTTAATQPVDAVFHDENLPIASEHVVTPGNVNNRPEFNFEEAPSEPRREPASLYACVTNGTLDLNKAARLILKQKRDGTFNQSVYDEFVRSEVASRVHYFRNTGILDIGDTVLEMRLTGIMNYMMAEIQCAKFDRYTRAVELSEKKDASGRINGRPTLSLKNCTRPWKLDGPAPFITADLRQMIVNYHPKEKETPFQLFAGLFRYILTRATNPLQKIQEYSLRLNGKNGRTECLLNLPECIQNLLLDFAEDLIGYGHNELRAAEANRTSSYFIKLGSTDEERLQEFDMLQQEKMMYRKESFKGLQLALRDVRSYTYDTTKAQWVPGDRKAKRTRLEVPEQENTNPSQEIF